MKRIKRILSIVIALTLLVSCSIPAVSFAEEVDIAYGWQGLGNPDSPSNINQILLKVPGADQIKVVHVARDYDDYYENRIVEPIDGSEGVSFTFAMSSGMSNLNPEDPDSFNKFISNNMNRIKILDEDRNIAAEYDGGKGDLYLNIEDSNGKIGDDKSTASIVIGVEKGVLSEGHYILQFDKNVCGNNTDKIIGVPIEFHFELKVVLELAELLKEVNEFIDNDKFKTYTDGEQGVAGFYSNSFLVDQLNPQIDEASDIEKNTDPEKGDDKAKREAAAKALYDAFKEFKETVIVKVNSVSITQPGESVFVGDTGTAKAEVSTTPDERKYRTLEWSVIPEDGCVSIDSETGEWSANYAGSADIVATSTSGTKWDESNANNKTIKKAVIVNESETGVVEICMRESGTLESLINKRAGAQQVEALKVYTASGATLSESDIIYINGLNGLTKLDLSNADCSEVKLANSSLETVILPKNLATVGEGAFSGCTGLRKIEIPASVKSISCSAFNGCKALLGELSVWGVTPPELTEQETISGTKLFNGCGITSIKVPFRSSGDYKNADGWNCGINIAEADIRQLELKNVQKGTLQQRAEEELQNLKLDDSQIDRFIITTGESYLDWDDIKWLRVNCMNATELDLSQAAMKDSAAAYGSKIKANTFKNRVTLKTVKLPDPIESISQYAFGGCENLSEVEFPSEIGKINNGAFSGCKRLPSVIYFECLDPPYFEGNPFDLGTVKTFVVPVQSVEKYKTAFIAAYGINFEKYFEVVPDISITLDKASVNLEAPATANLAAVVKSYKGDSRTVIWSSSNASVADVKEKEGATNTIIAKKAGTATITASDVSGAAKATCTVTVRNLPAPSVSAASAAYNKVKVSWGGVSGAQKYQVFRCNKSGTIIKSWTLGSTSRSLTDTGLTTGTAYYYKVRAYKTVSGVNYYGDYSSLRAGVPSLSKPATPSVSKSSKTTVKVKWKGISGETGYQVYRATSKNGKYSKVASVKMASSKYPYAKIKTKKGKTYYYKVRAYKKVGSKTVYSSFSSPKKYKLK
ncbi:MAG: leucine-rich repeat protein [Bacillota bacterium]|nr:leucine-rich repeat protein [Bacillota bacterium]